MGHQPISTRNNMSDSDSDSRFVNTMILYSKNKSHLIMSITLENNDTLTFNDSVLTLGTISIPQHQILRASFNHFTRTLSIPYIAKEKKKHFSLIVFEAIVQESDIPHAESWVESLLKTIYEDAGIKRSRKLLVLINPYSGRKKGVKIFSEVIQPIFRMAECSLEVIYTTRTGHAREIAKEIALDFDAVVTVSGDGLVHEVLNGFAQHAESIKAFAIPVAPIPTGSGNGLSLNILGIEDGFDVVAAALNAIKGKPMKVDVFSVTQGGKRSISFMSQSLGLMADLDIGTENLRWMGDARFIFGFIRGLMKFKPCSVQLSFKLEEDDKEKMAAAWQSRKEGRNLTIPPYSKSSNDALKYLPGEEDGWTIFNESILYVYAGKGPYVGRDMMAFPVSLPDDGFIDLMTMSRSSRSDILLSMNGATEGQTFWHPKVHYVKAHAYRVKPLKKEGSLSVDGEAFPFEEFQVDVEKGLATFLSPYGHYAANFGPKQLDMAFTLRKTSFRVACRAISTSMKQLEKDALGQWIASPPIHTLTDSLSVEHLSDLYVTLPTRDGSRKPFREPQPGTPLPFGHHLAFFHARRPERLLRADGTDGDISPPPPFSKRMWAGGNITWDASNPLIIGKPTKSISTVSSTEKKGFEKGNPMVFVTQNIQFTQEGEQTPSVTEERAHVYFNPEVSSSKPKKLDREVRDIPSTIDFAFRYTPSPVTLFRYSALMFNAHHIHLDKEYCQREEGYPERLVHGPLTAQMLLESVIFHFPNVQFSHFNYRATNPLFVNRKLTINGTWTDDQTIQLWCCDGNIIGMVGFVKVLPSKNASYKY